MSKRAILSTPKFLIYDARPLAVLYGNLLDAQ
jgi:hypothetical protein